MAVDVSILRSYLVELGFDIRSDELRKFDQAMNEAASLVQTSTGKILGDLFKWQVAITGAFAGISAGVVGLADHVAMQDQEFRLFGLQMQMRTEDAKRLKISLDALGEPLNVAVWDPELRGRLTQLLSDQEKFQAMLGPGYAGQMRALRDLRFEVTRLHVAMQYLAMLFVSKVFAQFGVSIENIQRKLESWVDYATEHLPDIATAFAQYITPVLKTTWELLQQSWHALEDFATMFTNVVGLLAGDKDIEGTTFKFENFAEAIQHVVHWLADFVRMMLFAEEATAHAGSEIALLLTGKFKEAAEEDKKLGEYMSADFRKPFPGRETQTSGGDTASITPSERANKAYTLAVQAGSETGIDPKLIFEQWAHETNNFTSRVFRDMNNMGGIRQGPFAYRNFQTLDEFKDFYVHMLKNKNYSSTGIGSATTSEEFAADLKRGGYYEDSYDHYVNGMKRFGGEYAQLRSGAGPQSVDNSVTMGDVHVHVQEPGASAEHIAAKTREAVRSELSDRDRTALAQLAGAN